MRTAVCLFLLCGTFAVAADDREEKVRYLRQLPKANTATESVFTLQRSRQGRHITSVTERGANRMSVSAHYDTRDVLIRAEATLREGEKASVVRVEVAAGKAHVKRGGQEVQEFEVPAGVIVTSAPDWTDTFALCRQYDRKKGGQQEFAGLWIHPRQPALRLTFFIEPAGTDAIEHAGKKLDLNRYLIRIRNNSRYVAWADEQGRMIKLMSLPYREGGGTSLVREGFEKSAAQLRPVAR